MVKNMKHTPKINDLTKLLSSIFCILLGILLASLGLKGFLLPNHFIDGGVTGISMLTSTLLHIELSIIILIINIPFVLVGIHRINWKFALRSTLAILGLALLIHFVSIPILTHDKLLSAIFGGISLGAGIGFALRGGAVLDGTEIVAIILSKKIGIKMGDAILIFNTVIFSVCAFFLGLEPALYSILTYMAASKSLDFLVYGFDFLGVNILSDHSNNVKNAIISELGLGITVYLGQRGYSNTEQKILFCVCSRLEVQKIKSIVSKIDKSAFITVHKISDAYGGLLKKASHLHHGTVSKY